MNILNTFTGIFFTKYHVVPIEKMRYRHIKGFLVLVVKLEVKKFFNLFKIAILCFCKCRISFVNRLEYAFVFNI